jgi:hypothetical protein
MTAYGTEDGVITHLTPQSSAARTWKASTVNGVLFLQVAGTRTSWVAPGRMACAVGDVVTSFNAELRVR